MVNSYALNPEYDNEKNLRRQFYLKKHFYFKVQKYINIYDKFLVYLEFLDFSFISAIFIVAYNVQQYTGLHI